MWCFGPFLVLLVHKKYCWPLLVGLSSSTVQQWKAGLRWANRQKTGLILLASCLLLSACSSLLSLAKTGTFLWTNDYCTAAALLTKRSRNSKQPLVARGFKYARKSSKAATDSRAWAVCWRWAPGYPTGGVPAFPEKLHVYVRLTEQNNHAWEHLGLGLQSCKIIDLNPQDPLTGRGDTGAQSVRL